MKETIVQERNNNGETIIYQTDEDTLFLDNTEQEIVRYIKGYYKKSDNFMDDLQKIFDHFYAISNARLGLMLKVIRRMFMKISIHVDGTDSAMRIDDAIFQKAVFRWYGLGIEAKTDEENVKYAIQEYLSQVNAIQVANKIEKNIYRTLWYYSMETMNILEPKEDKE